MVEVTVPALEAMSQPSLEGAAPVMSAEAVQPIVSSEALATAGNVDAVVGDGSQIDAAGATKAIQDLSTINISDQKLGEDGLPPVRQQTESPVPSADVSQQKLNEQGEPPPPTPVPDQQPGRVSAADQKLSEDGQPPTPNEADKKPVLVDAADQKLNEEGKPDQKAEQPMSEDEKIAKEIDDGVKNDMDGWIKQHPEPARDAFSSNIDYQKAHGEWSRQYASQERQSHRDTAEAVHLDRWEKSHPRPDPATDPEGHRQWVKDKAAQKYDGGPESKNEAKGRSEDERDKQKGEKKDEEEKDEQKDEKDEEKEDNEAAEKLRRLAELKKAKAFYDKEIKRLEAANRSPQENAALEAHKIAKDLIEKEIAKLQQEVATGAGKGNRFLKGAMVAMTIMQALQGAADEGV